MKKFASLRKNNLDRSSNNLNNSLEESNDSMIPTSKIETKNVLNVPTSSHLINANGLNSSEILNLNSNWIQSENSNNVNGPRLLSPTMKQRRDKVSKSKFHTDIISQWVQINTSK